MCLHSPSAVITCCTDEYWQVGFLGDTGVSVCAEAELNPLPQFPGDHELLVLLLLALDLGTVLIKTDVSLLARPQ